MRRFLLSACTLVAVPLQPASANTVAAAEDIVVTASRSGTAIENLPISVSLVSEEALEGQLKQNRNVLSGLEALVPGLNLQDSEDRGSCLTRLRGRAVSFMINGVPVNEDLRQGSCTGPFTISPFAIERIEVVRGGTALYGAGAPGGIINLITKQGRTDRLQIDATAQSSFNTARAHETFTTDLYVGGGQKVGDFDYYVGAAYTDGGRVRDAEGDPVYSNGYDAIDLSGSFGLALADGSALRLTASFHDEDVDALFYPSGETIPGTNISRVMEVASHPYGEQAGDRDVAAALSYAHPDLLAHNVSLSLFYQHQSIKQRDNFFSAENGNDFFATNRKNERLGIRSALVRSYDLGAAALKTSYGVDYTRNSFYRFTVDPAADEAIIGYISPQVVLRTYAAFAQLELEAGPLTVTGGARREWYRGEITDKGYDPTLPRAATPGDIGKSALTLVNIGAIYRITPTVQIYGGFSQGAELSQLGRSARGIAVPARLTPEPASSDQYEIGVRGRVGALGFGLAAYHSRSKKAAELQSDPSCANQPGLCPLIPLRVPQRFRGVEANADWNALPNLTVSTVFTLQRGKIYDEEAGRFVSYATDVVVPLRITGRAEWKPVEPARVSFQLSHYGASSYYTPTEQGLGFVDTEAVTLASGSVAYALGPVELFVAADNLFNKSYVSPNNQVSGAGDAFYYRAAGRRVTFGVTGKF